LESERRLQELCGDFEVTQIKNIRGDILFEAEGSVKEVVEQAIQNRITLPNVDLFAADLQGANLAGGFFKGAYLKKANLSGATLDFCYMSEADFTRAHLVEASLVEASIARADFEYTDFTRANFTEAILSGSFTFRTNFSGANLTKACLRDMSFSSCSLEGANLTETKIDPYSTAKRVSLVLPNMIEISGVARTIREWEDILPELSYDYFTLAHYQSCKAFLLHTIGEEPASGVSRFERLAKQRP